MSDYRTEPCSICGESVLVDKRINYGQHRPAHWSCKKGTPMTDPYPKVEEGTDPVIPYSVLTKLPHRMTLRGCYEGVPDMAGDKHRAVRVLWRDEHGPRQAFFSLRNGKYLCEYTLIGE